MSDIIDQANDRAIADEAIAEAAIRAKAAAIPAGQPGECNTCGEWTGRLVNGTCARCRDRYHLP